jgi:hypothetical protein
MVAATSVLRIDHSTISRRMSRLDQAQAVRDRVLLGWPAADRPMSRRAQSSQLSPRELIHNGGACTALASLGIAAERTIAADSRDGVPG